MGQMSLFEAEDDKKTPAEAWSEDVAKHALDELFNATYARRNSEEYLKLMEFVSRFRFYSPYNAMLIRIQRPGPGLWRRPHDGYVISVVL